MITSRSAAAVLGTNRGSITIQMDATRTPCAIASFAYLASKHYFDYVPCHRVVSRPSLRFLNCGDPSGIGYGGPRYQFADEDPVVPSTPSVGPPSSFYARGTVALVNTGPDTNGSQFLLFDRDSVMPGGFERIGTITSGIGILDTVVAAGNDGATVAGFDGGSPVLTTTIRSVTVTFG